MHRKTIRRFGAAAIVSATAFAGLTSTASAQVDPADVQKLVENAPAAGQALADGLQGALGTAAETQSAEATSQAVGTALVDSGGALVEGTEQFGALGLGFMLVNLAVQNAAAPYLQAIDDPSTAPGLVDPEDIQGIADGAPGFAEGAQAALTDGAVHLLQGNIIDPPLGFGPAFWGSGVVGTLAAGFENFDGTPIGPVFQAAGITSLVAGGALEGPLTQVEDGAAPVFEGAAPVTDQVVALLQGL